MHNVRLAIAKFGTWYFFSEESLSTSLIPPCKHTATAGLRHTKYMGEIAAAAAPSGTGAAPLAHPWRHARPREVYRVAHRMARSGVAANALGEPF